MSTRFPLPAQCFGGVSVLGGCLPAAGGEALPLDFLSVTPWVTKPAYFSLLASKPIVFSTGASAAARTKVMLFQKRKQSYLLIHVNPGAGFP